MNESPSTPTPSQMTVETPADPSQSWPFQPARPGIYYTTIDPGHPEDQLVVMLMETFQMFGTELAQYKKTARAQDLRIKELLGAQSVLAQRAAELEDRLQAIRDVRRREKRAEMEDGLITPGDPRFSPQRNRKS